MKYSFDRNQTTKIWGGERCQLCSSYLQMEIHHITHKRNNAMSIFNSILLCHNCHKKYGSSSAGDIVEHLNLSAFHIIKKIDWLKEKDLMFNQKTFFNENDKKFLEEFKKYYDIKTFRKLQKML